MWRRGLAGEAKLAGELRGTIQTTRWKITLAALLIVAAIGAAYIVSVSGRTANQCRQLRAQWLAGEERERARDRAGDSVAPPGPAVRLSDIKWYDQHCSDQAQ
ncbi:MAG: hypothetical protein ABI647_24260 [Gemmatimonadota bacterium]